MNKCIWKLYDYWESNSIFNTSCDNTFEFMNEGIKENHFKFCPYCGGKITEVRIKLIKSRISPKGEIK